MDIYYNEKGEIPPRSVTENGKLVINPGASPAWREANGYTLTENPVRPEVLPEVKLYSKYKIVCALGERWAAVREQITSAGLWDLWEAAQDLSSDDPNFASFFATLSEEDKAALEACRVG